MGEDSNSMKVENSKLLQFFAKPSQLLLHSKHKLQNLSNKTYIIQIPHFIERLLVVNIIQHLE